MRRLAAVLLALSFPAMAQSIRPGGASGGGGTTDATKIPLSTVTTNGDLILGTGASTVGRLGVGGNNTLLTSNGTVPSWVAASLLPNSLASANGDIPHASGSGVWGKLSIGANNTLLTSNGTTASWVAPTWIPVSTGTTNGDVAYFNGTSWVRIGIGTNGYVLTSNGTIPSWAAATASGAVNLQGATPGVAQVGHLNISGTGIFGTVTSNGNIGAAGTVSGAQLNTSGVTVASRSVSLTLGATANAYGIHQIGGGTRLAAIATPAAPVATNVGTTGATTYTYRVTCRDAYGNSTPESATGTTTTGNATLTGSNYNVVSWVVPDGAYDCQLCKADTTHVLATVVAPANSYSDNSTAAGSVVTAPTRNTTSDALVDGLMTASQGLIGGPIATASLPTTCTNGTIVWDSTSLSYKVCNANAWSALGSGGTPTGISGAPATITGTAAATATQFQFDTPGVTPSGAAHPFSVKYNGSEVFYLDAFGNLFGTSSLQANAGFSGVRANQTYSPGGLLDLKSGVTDGASAVAIQINTDNTLSTAGSKLLSVRNNTVEKMATDFNGKSVYPTGGAADVVGTATLVTGTKVVSTTAVTASSKILYSRHTTGGTVGQLSISAITAGTSFTILSSSGTETSTIDWFIIN